MHSHRLTHEGGPAGAKWQLEWDDAAFTLRDPDGQLVFECSDAQAHRVIEVYELYAEGKVSFATPHGSLTFKKHRAAAAGLRLFVEAGLRADPEYLAQLRRESARAIPRGLVMFVVAGGLFGLYCWWAFTNDDPPPGTWLRWVLVWFGWLIHGVLLVLMGVALAGPFVSFFGLRQWWRFCRIGRAVAAGETRHAEPDAAADGGA